MAGNDWVQMITVKPDSCALDDCEEQKLQYISHTKDWPLGETGEAGKIIPVFWTPAAVERRPAGAFLHVQEKETACRKIDKDI